MAISQAMTQHNLQSWAAQKSCECNMYLKNWSVQLILRAQGIQNEHSNFTAQSLKLFLNV